MAICHPVHTIGNEEVPGIPEEDHGFRQSKNRERSDGSCCFGSEQKSYLSEIWLSSGMSFGDFATGRDFKYARTSRSS